MSKRAKIGLIKYGSCAVFVAAMAAFYISQRDFAGGALVDRYLILCDAFTIPGLMLLLVGCLIWVSNMGALDGIAYAINFCVRSLNPGARHGMDEKFGDYVARKREKRLKGYGFLFISGGVTMAVAIVFMILFYQLY